MSIVFVLFTVVQHSKAQFTSTQRIILCNETISNSISGGQSHYYQLNTNRFYEVNFMTCESDIDVTVHVLDDSDSNNDISNDYCSDGDVCGSCNTENHDHENFTIPLQSASYYIQIEPYSTTVIGGQYELTISCMSVQLTTMSCGETTNDFIEGDESKYYQITITDSANVMIFDDCASDTDLVVAIFNGDGIDISSDHCSYGDWCGSCVNEDNYPENFTLPNLSPQTYLIYIHTYSKSVENGTLIFTVECVNATAVTPRQVSNMTTSMIPESTPLYSTVECGSIIHGEASPYRTFYHYLHLSQNTSGLVFDYLLMISSQGYI
eukprot:71165_1